MRETSSSPSVVYVITFDHDDGKDHAPVVCASLAAAQRHMAAEFAMYTQTSATTWCDQDQYGNESYAGIQTAKVVV